MYHYGMIGKYLIIVDVYGIIAVNVEDITDMMAARGTFSNWGQTETTINLVDGNGREHLLIKDQPTSIIDIWIDNEIYFN